MGVCLDCDEDNQVWFFDHNDEKTSIDEQIKRWRNHAKNASHEPSIDFEVIYVEYQNGGTDVQYSLSYDFGKFIVEKVHNPKLGIQEGDVLVNFNGNDVRRKGPTFVKEKTDRISEKKMTDTICTATFLRPPIPLDLLDRKKKVPYSINN